MHLKMPAKPLHLSNRRITEPGTSSTRSAADFIPPNPTLAKLRGAAAHCRGCDLWVNATQTVFGEGPASAEVMLVGEQPGDLEDRAGHPFVGPAGKLLDKALLQAGIDRTRVYVTNSVKHFKFVPIEGERQALLGKQFRVTEARGKPMPSELAEAVVATVHPSAVLRAPDDTREQARRQFFTDLQAVARYLKRSSATSA